MDLGAAADPLEVERMVQEMMHALQKQDFRGQDGLSAALTFSYRLSKALIQLCPEEEKQRSMKAIVMAFQRVGAMLEAEFLDVSKEKVH